MSSASLQSGQVVAQASDLSTVLLWTGLLIGAVLVASTLVLWIRRRLLAKDAAAGPGMSLHELRTLRDQGRLSDEEFESLRLALVRHASGGAGPKESSERSASGSPTPDRTQTRVVDWDARAKPGYDLTGRPLPDSEDDQGPAEPRDRSSGEPGK